VRRRRIADVFLIAACGALVAAAIEVLVLEWRLRVAGNIAWDTHGIPVGRDVTWMAPLSFLLLFLVPAALLALLALVAPKWVPARVPGIVFGFLTALGVLLLVPQIHQSASLVLALGIGVAIGRLAMARANRFRAIVSRTAIALAAVFVALGVTARTARLLAERRAVAALPEAANGSPNVLLIILDTVRAQNMSLYGYARPTTPSLDSLARESVVFDQAFATAPWTLPTHASIFTGRYAGELSTRWTVALDGHDRTLAEALASRGYATGGFVANAYYTTYETGLGRGFARFEDVTVSPAQILWSSSLAQTPFFIRIAKERSLWAVKRALQTFDLRIGEAPEYGRRHAAQVNREFLDWQAALDGRPFFAFLNYFDAHGPYDPPGSFRTRFASEPDPEDRYDGSIAYMDHEIATLLAELRRRGVLDNTIVVVTADHGELFGEWGQHGHGNAVYVPLLHVPLLVRYPARVPGGVRLRGSVTLRDLARTITDLAGVDVGPPFSGASLATLWDSSATPERSDVIADFEGGDTPDKPTNAPPMVAVIDDTLQYIRQEDGVEKLFDLRTAVSDTTNLALRPERAASLAALRARAGRLGRARPIVASW
jgi:arylsulfatase A-like enzyme